MVKISEQNINIGDFAIVARAQRRIWVTDYTYDGEMILIESSTPFLTGLLGRIIDGEYTYKLDNSKHFLTLKMLFVDHPEYFNNLYNNLSLFPRLLNVIWHENSLKQGHNPSFFVVEFDHEEDELVVVRNEVEIRKFYENAVADETIHQLGWGESDKDFLFGESVLERALNDYTLLQEADLEAARAGEYPLIFFYEASREDVENSKKIIEEVNGKIREYHEWEKRSMEPKKYF